MTKLYIYCRCCGNLNTRYLDLKGVTMIVYYVYCPICGILKSLYDLDSALETVKSINYAHENMLQIIDSAKGVIEDKIIHSPAD